MIEKFTMHALISDQTTTEELAWLADFLTLNVMCGIGTPYPEGKTSVCFRQRHSAEKKCGGAIYRELNALGLDRPLQ